MGQRRARPPRFRNLKPATCHMNTLTPLFNREGQLPADGWFHLVPRGEYPNTTDDGRRVMQVLDDTAFDAMLKNFAPKLLIDQEHFSHDTGKSSEAFGWVAELQKRADGVWGRVEWTDLGEQAIKNRRYRFISPTWTRLQKLDADRLRPLRLPRHPRHLVPGRHQQRHRGHGRQDRKSVV